ncbi:uncharacterized protein N7484_003734 [Penicillium longicatenatum]|uniref:uncharacterized protein n=1 Tax=Penicillium longicatenatum TaxID=1561947 RepID=UPI0025471746|nr:uncharacterized protein N7484_003734 [Penicillium longicatenatum]KAJ5650011.1 hypothetical protein N7484_003734 [Penicillium longicatenatum]
MSNGLPFLNKLRKPELAEIAERTDLQDYDDYNKVELIAALDKHLVDNRTIFSGDKKLAEFYTRLSSTARRGSPVKRELRADVSPVIEKKTPGRRSTKPKEEESAESDDAAFKTPAAKTPSATRATPRSVRSVVESASAQFPPSPAVVTDAIDRQTAKMREGLEHAWTESGFIERSHALRATLSSLKAIETIFVLVEASYVLYELVPLRYLTTTPAVPAAHLPSFSIKVPDLFVLLTGAFWAPFSLWFLTNLGLPLLAAYFFNLSWQAATGGSQGPARRTRSTSSLASFDPLSFNIAKALLVYKVYVDHFHYVDLFSKYAIQKVNFSIPGQYSGMLTGTAIGVIGTLYEAILRRS